MATDMFHTLALAARTQRRTAGIIVILILASTGLVHAQELMPVSSTS